MAAKATDELSKLNLAANGVAKPVTNGVNGHASDESEDDGDEKADTPGVESAANGTAKKKKKKKPRKKKSSAAKTQSDPPRVPVSQLFPQNKYPKGEEVEYTDNKKRTTTEETRYLGRMDNDFLAEYRQGAEIHRQVRQYAQRFIKPGSSLHEIADGIEDTTRALTGHAGLEEGDHLIAGVGFPTGLSINHCAAHYTPNTTSKKWILEEQDVLKVDIGVHINQRIVDSAFTLTWDPKYDNLLAAVKDATNTGVREAGIDVRVGDIGAAIQEAMESYEVELDGKTYPVKSIKNLNGHDIIQGSIHGGKSVPIVKSNDQTKMEEGEIFAIETFGSTGKGYVVDDLETSHYGLIKDAPNIPLRVSSAKTLLNTIKKNFGTLPFCRRHLDRLGQEKYLLGLTNLVQNGIVNDYPPLVDVKGSYTAQFEHTILLRPDMKEVVSRGDDY